MPFTKGDKNINRSGRKSGSTNKTTTEIRKKYLELIENNFEQLETDLKSLRASERVKAIIELSKLENMTIQTIDELLDFIETNYEKLSKEKHCKRQD